MHEAAHVDASVGRARRCRFQTAGARLTAGGKYADASRTSIRFDLSQTFEDLGVAAYKGQAANLIANGDILTTALRIHSVEARHAAEVRKHRRQEAVDRRLR